MEALYYSMTAKPEDVAGISETIVELPVIHIENESIWLHMEYKYLLELLKSGLYEEYFADLKKMGVPFLPYETYGRSPL